MHHATHSGLQQHSVGEIYPWTVRGKGDTLQGFHCLTGEEGPRFQYTPSVEGSFSNAHRLAELWIENERIGLDIIDSGRLEDGIRDCVLDPLN